jgi:hypothetical protein
VMDQPTDPAATERTPRLTPAHLSDAERDADVWARTIIEGRLARMRELATQWGATVTALTALFGIGTVIDADDPVRALDPPGWGVLYGVLAGLAVLLAGGALYKAAKAAQAQVRAVPPDVQGRLRLQDDLLRASVGSLRWSRILALLALVALIGSFAVRWYAPVKPEPEKPAASASVISVHGQTAR